MMDYVRAWPEYPEMLQIVQEMAVDVERMSKHIWEISQRGNVFSNCKCNGNSRVFYSHA